MSTFDNRILSDFLRLRIERFAGMKFKSINDYHLTQCTRLISEKPPVFHQFKNFPYCVESGDTESCSHNRHKSTDEENFQVFWLAGKSEIQYS